ncbi:MAG: ATP-binding protein, partial [Victivallales bacterium]|nr:ATP-binding protein [Victivallales bacterium]
MIQVRDIPALLGQLENKIADELEGQELDFKQWEDNFKEMMKTLVRAVVSFANAGEGMVIAGVKEQVKGFEKAIIGVPRAVDALRVQRSIYDNTEPHITVRIHEISVDYGTGRLLAIQVFPGMPPYTTSDGAGWIRVGKENKPLTGSRRREMMESMGYHDATATVIEDHWKNAYSPAALERLREMMVQGTTPLELQRMNDEDLLHSIGALKDGRMTIAGLLMVGKSQFIEKYIPCHRWAFRKMVSDTEYVVRDEGNDAIPLALRELERYIEADNPVSTLEIGFLQPEFKKYPQIAIREGIM